MCDFESACLWTPSNHSQHGDWKVMSPSQAKSEQAGTVPASDHSARSSKGKRGKLSLKSEKEKKIYFGGFLIGCDIPQF